MGEERDAREALKGKKRSFSGELVFEWEQEEILKVLAEQLEGFAFYEKF